MVFKKGTKNKNWNGFKRGMTPWNKDKHSASFKCEICRKVVACSPSRIRRFCNLFCYNKSEKNKKGQFTKGQKPWNAGKIGWAEGTKAGFQKGEENPSWKGGITSDVRKMRNSNRMQDWRLKVFNRDNFTCQECDQVGGSLEAHHLEAFKDLFGTDRQEEIFDIKNGQTLCQSCHAKIDKYRAPKNV